MGINAAIDIESQPATISRHRLHASAANAPSSDQLVVLYVALRFNRFNV
jgi:hypothetical protein